MNTDKKTESFFHDEKLNNTFHEKGYVKFQLFNKQELEELNNFYKQIEKEHTQEGRNFHTTLNSSNESLIKRVNEFILPYYNRNLPKILKNYKHTIAGFLVKDGGENTEMCVHQDWTYVDEEKHSSFNIWVSLDDTNSFNGNLCFIPGSHKFIKSLRGSPNNPLYFEKYLHTAEKYLIDIPTKAGECIVFNQALIHASRGNRSKKARIATILSAYSKDADMLHFYFPKNSNFKKVERYKFSVNSMLEMKKDERPTNVELIDIINYKQIELDEKEFIKFCRKNISIKDQFKIFISALVK